MRRAMACAWCKRETVNGMAVGAPLLLEKYRGASHGHCLSCGDDFEKGLASETILARAQARAIGLAPAAPSESGKQ